MKDKQTENKPKITMKKISGLFILLGVSIVIILIFLSIYNSDTIERIDKILVNEKKDNPDFLLLIISMLVSTTALASIVSLLDFLKKDRNDFLEVDEEKSKGNQEIIAKHNLIIHELESQKCNEEVVKYNNFDSYFNLIVSYLDNQVISSDKKASILLYRGTFYIRGGILLYFAAIIVWQILIHYCGFDIKYIYGILSSSLLFIFIEFVGAWFLRQYKQFVDTSTYLIKIKSILQRYILAYFALKDAKVKGFDANPLVSMLQEEIKWPETYLLKKPDVNFAKECLETATNFIKSLPINNKNQDEK